MSISYSRPLGQGFNRMKSALFHPFDLSKWFKIGFTAWLAALTDCHGNGGSGNNTSNADWDEFFAFPQTAQEWLFDNPLWANLILVGIILLFAFITIMIWVSSRGKFMFLHNVACEKSDISYPWHEYKKEGNSLFLFEFIFGWLAFAVFVLFFIHCFQWGKELYNSDASGALIFAAVAQMILLFFAYIIVFGYVSLFLKDFVVPIMYKNRVNVFKAWSKFLSLLGKRFFTFIIYGLFIFILGIGVAIGVIFLAVITCCVGLLLLAIPYIGAVILLPVSYTFRAFSIEFLAQFGDDYNVFQPKGFDIIETDPT